MDQRFKAGYRQKNMQRSVFKRHYSRGQEKKGLWTFQAEDTEEKTGVKSNGQMRSVGHIPPKSTKEVSG